jgi:hypothetical protein
MRQDDGESEEHAFLPAQIVGFPTDSIFTSCEQMKKRLPLLLPLDDLRSPLDLGNALLPWSPPQAPPLWRTSPRLVRPTAMHALFFVPAHS